ncbi:MAG: hypothetical protein ACMXYM_00595 [Candidatus Woesearchaeota archaeon]
MRYSIVLGIIGFVVSVFLFYETPEFVLFLGPVVCSVVVFGAAGYVIDRYVQKKVLVSIIVVALFIMVSGYASMMLYLSNFGYCESSALRVVENVVTGQCHVRSIDCSWKPWYLTYSERCKIQSDVLFEQEARKRCAGRSDFEFCVTLFVERHRRG